MTDEDKKKKTEATPVDVTPEEDEAADDDAEDDESDEETEEESEEESDDESEDSKDEDDSSSKKKEELDLDAEIEKERKAGDPDPAIAKKAFEDRKTKRGTTDEKGDKPLTQKDLADFEAKIRKDAQQERALEIATGLAGSEKEAELIVLKWQNRTFPKNLPLVDQIQEAFVITHAKKLVGERNEALRALKGKQGATRIAPGTHRDAIRSGAEPKMSPADAAVIKQSGFKWSHTNKRFEKKLSSGAMLIRDPKTKQVRLEKKSR